MFPVEELVCFLPINVLAFMVHSQKCLVERFQLQNFTMVHGKKVSRFKSPGARGLLCLLDSKASSHTVEDDECLHHHACFPCYNVQFKR